MIIKNNKLIIEESIIDSPEYDLSIKTDNEFPFACGILTLADGTTSYIDLKKYGDSLKGKIIITKEQIELLNKVYFHIIMLDSSFEQKTNQVKLKFDIDKIKLNYKIKETKELVALHKTITELKEQIFNLTSGKILEKINIINKDYIQKGMVLTAINKNDFVAAFPFNDCIKKLNGIEPVAGELVVDSTNIKYKNNKTLEQEKDEIVSVLKLINETQKVLANSIKEISNRLTDVELKIEHLNSNGII